MEIDRNQKEPETQNQLIHSPIAVIGIALRISGADKLSDYWDIIANKIDCVEPFPAYRRKLTEDLLPYYTDADSDDTQFYPGSFMKGIDEFDCEYFQMSPKEASLTDPVHRLFLEAMINTFNDAGYPSERLKKTRTGVFVGYASGNSNYTIDIFLNHKELMPYAIVGNMPPLLASRASHYLDLQGPTMILDTACSSSLVAIHEACESIRSGTCDMAVAGGVKINMLPVVSENMKIGIESMDGKTRTFDSMANGASNGEGVASVLLKPLDAAKRDGDNIYAVIRGSAINHDGAASAITAPNPAAQTQVILQAWKNSGVDPRNIAYFETHGTATALGDPIEVQGLTKAFEQYTTDKQFCALSGVKGNLGHLFECAGIASFVKAICALRNREIPPLLHFREPNPNIPFIDSPFYVNTIVRPWPEPTSGNRVCGVSAFGLSGTNCHLVLEEYSGAPDNGFDIPDSADSGTQLVLFSAKSPESLAEICLQNRDFLLEHAETLDFRRYAYNTNTGRSLFSHRLSILAKNAVQLADKLNIVIENGLQTDKKEGIYCEVVPKLPNDPLEKREYKRALAVLSEDIAAACAMSASDSEALSVIADLLVRGGSVRWGDLYRDYRPIKMSLPGYPFKRERLWLPQKEALLPQSGLFYQKVWCEKPAADAEDALSSVCIVTREDRIPPPLLSSLEKLGANTTVLCRKEMSFTEQQWETLSAMAKKEKSVDILLLTPYLMKTGVIGLTALYDVEEWGLSALLELAQWLERDEPETSLNLYVLADNSFEVTGEESGLKPENTPLYGFGKGIQRENRLIRFCYIDIEKEADYPLAAREISFRGNVDAAVYRAGNRYVEGITEIKLSAGKENSPLLHPDGVYIITGGLGGIGFEVAKTICLREPGASLLIINRTRLPIDAGNNDTQPEDPELAEKLNRYRQLSRMARRVEYLAADVADEAELSKAIAEARKWGAIRGVVHAAGVGGGILIKDLTMETMAGRIAPKIYGTWVLDNLTKDDPLDFFVMFSSIATVFSSMELADYTAANSYLDYFAEYRNRRGGGHTYTVNWATWSETGMSVKHSFTQDTLFKTITIRDGIRGLFEVLAQEHNHVIIGKLNLDNNIALLLNHYPVELSPYIQKKLAALKNKDKHTAGLSAVAGDITVTGGGAYREIELHIAQACQEVLGYSEIDINDSFFELGADSILMGRIYTLLAETYGDRLEVTDLFAYPSIRQLSEFLSSKGAPDLQRKDESQKRLSQAAVRSESADVAVIGVGITLPCADTLEDYWELLSNGICAVREVPHERSRYLKEFLTALGTPEEDIRFMKDAYLDEIDKFDYELFGMSPRESKLIDPINRLFLQSCWKAIEDSGSAGSRLRGSNTGVFLGYTANLGNMYSRLLYETDPELFGESLPVNQVSMAASRIAYVNDLKGPSMVIDTACSSSLVSVHMACEQIRSGGCDMALAGGASITMLPLENGFRVGFETSEDKTRSFSEYATGTAVGEGVGVLLLKPLDRALEDKDHIHAVIKGSAVNQDGSSFGIAAPNYLAQAEVIQKAWRNAGVAPLSISYIEAHGTGTPLGDPIEVKGITEAFRNYTQENQFCAFGTVKTNIGHLNEAAGVSGIVKLILMLKHRELLPSLHFGQPNPNIDFVHSPLYMVTNRRKWETDQPVLRAGISGFGMSGTNCHIVFEEPPCEELREAPADTYAAVLSCQYRDGLEAMCSALAAYIRENKDSLTIDSVCYTLQMGRKHHAYRAAFLVSDLEELCQKLKQAERRGIVSDQEKVFLGRYSIVPENKTKREAYEITAEESARRTRQAAAAMESLAAGEQRGWPSLLTLYVGGAEVDWLPLYPNPVHRVPLPLYPFQRHHCWVEPPVTSETAFLKEFDHLFYQLTWQAYPLVESPVKTLPSVLVLCHNGDLLNGLSQALTAKHATVSTVLLSTGKREISGNRYICGYSAQDIEWLFIQLENKSIDTLVYITPSGEQAQDDYAGIQENLDKGLFAVMNLIKGITKAHYHHEMELILISYNGYCVTKSESVLSPHNAATLSIGRVIEQEYPHFSARAIDTDLTTGTNQLAEEILNSDHRQYLISYRGGIRYAQCFGRAEVEPVRTMIRRDGNYLITGGTGDIGLETARYLAQTGCRSVTLLSRSGFPDRSRWDDSDLSPGDRGKVEILRQIEQYGVLLIIESVDICQYDVLTERLEQARQKTGPFHGVFHSAGLAGAGFILRKEDADTWKVLDPKIKGTWFLDQATRLDPLDFMVLYSSAVTQSGEAGQSDYVAANTYLDAYCDYRNALGKRTFAINWVSWKETGMSVRFGINVDTITRALPTSLALEGLDLLLKSDYKRVMIGQYTVSSNILIMDEYSRNLVTEDMRQKIQRYKDSLNRDLSGSSIIREGDREVAQIYKGRVRILPHSEKDKVDENTFSGLNINLQTRSPEEVEDNITKVYSAVLGYKDIDIYDNFFEMGGDSIILTRMQGFIDQMYPDAITAADLFEYTSVFTLSQYIYETLGRKKQTDARNTALAAPLAAYAEAPNILPLSAAQQRVYISHRMSKNKLTYNNPFICRVESGLSREAHLEIARRLMHRHEALRTGFSLKGKSVQQEIYDGLEPMIEYVSYAAAADIDFNTLLTKFDLAKPPLFKITVIELDNGGTIMFFDIHHIIADGYSSRMLHRDIGMIHRKEQMPEQRYQYRHYVMWERGFNQNEAYGNMKRYWEEKLRNYCPPIRYVPEKGGCPGEYPLPIIRQLENGTTDSASVLASRLNTTPFVLYLSALNILLYNISGSEHPLVGISVLGRSDPDVMNIVGMFANLLPLWGEVSAKMTVDSIVRATHTELFESLQNQMFPYNQMVELVNRTNDAPISNLFNILFEYESEQMGDMIYQENLGSDFVMPSRYAKYDICLLIFYNNNQPHIRLEYNGSLYGEEAMENLCGQYLLTLEHLLAAEPDMCADELLSEEAVI